jgi:hypothetical protein
MKLLFRVFLLATLTAGVWFATGCASSESDNFLTRAGFDAVRADTTAQIEALKKLGPDSISVVHRNGRSFYVFADPLGGLIFVGNEADFARYRKLRASQGSRNQEAELPLVDSQGALILSAWGGWKGWDT